MTEEIGIDREYQIGEIVTLPDRTKARVEKGGKDCTGCIFETCNVFDCFGECNGKSRTDHTDIIYREIID